MTAKADVLEAHRRGLTNAEIATSTGHDISTVRSTLSNNRLRANRRQGLTRRQQFVLEAYERGLTVQQICDETLLSRSSVVNYLCALRLPAHRPDRPVTTNLVVPVTVDELAEVRRRAEEVGLSTNEYVRQRCLGPKNDEVSD